MSLRSFKASLFSLCVLTLCCGRNLVAAESNSGLAAASIPALLKSGASLVIRQAEEEIEIENTQTVKIKKHEIFTLLNSKAAHARYLIEGFSSLESIDNIEATIYDEAGTIVKKIRPKDFKVQVDAEAGKFSDARIKEYFVNYAVYPFTIEFSSSTVQHHTFQLPHRKPQSSHNVPDVAIEKAQLTVTAPAEAGFRYKCFNAPDPVISTNGSLTKWSWELKGRPIVKQERLCVAEAGLPSVQTMINTISIEDFSGSGASWKSVGTLVWKLNEGRDVLTPADKELVHTLIFGAGTEKEKIRLLYQYVQKHTRYVMLATGIGGWQTAEATFVGNNHYGDCKALSNYTMALLKEGGIASYPVLISAGERFTPLAKDFPATYFNHEILCVPSVHDTLWLECTSTTSPMNYLGTFTADRDALMITPEGGIVVHTPGLRSEQNLLNRNITATLTSDMAFEIKAENSYAGYWFDKTEAEINRMSAAELKQYVNAKFPLVSYSANDYKYSELVSGDVPVVKESLDMTTKGMVMQSAKRLMIDIDLIPLPLPEMEESDARNSEFFLPYPVSVIDTFTIDVPKSKSAEYLPNPAKLQTAYGSYVSEVRYSGEKGEIVNVRSLSLQAGTYPSSQYHEFTKFINQVKHMSREKVVLSN